MTILSNNQIKAGLFSFLFAFSSSVMSVTIFDWRTSSASNNGINYSLTSSGITVTSTAYVAELDNNNSNIFGPVFATNQLSGFIRSTAGLGLQIDTGSTIDPTSGTERGYGLFRPGFNSDNYLSGNENIEAMNFAVFEFDSPVILNTLTVDDTSNFGRGSWLATSSTAPNFGGSIEDTLNGYSIFNAPDTESSDGEFTTVFNSTENFTYLLIGAPPSINIAGIEGSSGQQFYIQSFGVTAVPLPASLPFFTFAMMGVFGIKRFLSAKS